MKNIGQKVKFCELFLRDGIQGWPEVVSTADKIRLLEVIDGAGVAEIDVTSFVPSHIVPQFSDANKVLEAYNGKAKVRVLTVNEKGVQRVVETFKAIGTIDSCGMPFSASESHNIANLRCDHATHKARIEKMVDVLGVSGVKPMVCVATAWGCPIIGKVPQDKVIEHVDWLYGLGVKSIMLGDTTGMANPGSVFSLFQPLISHYSDVEFIAHFHDNRGAGIANALTAIEVGVTTIDGCLGGMGGEPAAIEQGDVGSSGNVISEDLLALLDQMGYATGVSMDALLQAGALAEEIVGKQLFSKIQRSGLIRVEPLEGEYNG